MNLKDGSVRIHNSVTASAERRLLTFLAARTPAFVSPDALTVLGVIGGLVVLGGYGLSNLDARYLWLVNAGLVIHWLGDSLDGTLARYRRIERPRYGFFLDQSVDAFTNVLIGVGVGWSPFVNMDIAMLVLAGYQLMSIYAFVRAVASREFLVSSLGIGPTEFRLAIVTMNVAIMAIGAPQYDVLGASVTWCDGFGLLLALGLMFSFCCHVAAMARALRTVESGQVFTYGRTGGSVVY